MNINPYQTKKLNKKASFVLIFAIVLLNNESIFSSFLPIDSSIFVLFIIFAFGFVFLLKHNNIILNLSKRSSTYITLILFLISVTAFANSDFTGGYLKIVLGIISGLIIMQFIDKKTLLESFLFVMVFLSIYSLIFTYAYYPIFYANNLFPTFYNSEGISFINGFFSVRVNDIMYFRNFGVFREPGVYQLFLNVALLLNLYYFKTNKFITVVLIVTLLSTFSTIGYIVLGIIIAYECIKYIRNKNISIKAEDFITLFILSLLVIYISIALNLFNNIVDVMNKFFYQESSYNVRVESIIRSFEIGFGKPFFGYGISDGFLVRFQGESQLFIHNTSTSGAVFLVFGVFFFVIYHRLVFDLAGLISKQKKVKGIVFLCLLLMINSQLFIYNELLTIMFVISIDREQSTITNKI